MPQRHEAITANGKAFYLHFFRTIRIKKNRHSVIIRME
ncbi:hypothetical protein AZZ82_004202 [Klebsiella aerogenes]|nr:hypothetical protein AZZ82_004202 [Klebsiella aerogenes]